MGRWNLKMRRHQKSRMRFEKERKRRFRLGQLIRNREKSYRSKDVDLPKDKVVKYSKNKSKPLILIAPTNWSLINNPDELLDFFDRIHKLLLNKIKVTLDFSNISTVSPDGIALLLAKISNPKFHNKIAIYVIKPANTQIDKLFSDSGFYHFIGVDPVSSTRGLITTLRNKFVDTEIAKKIRKQVAIGTFDEDIKLPAVYRTLIECMANTKKHAKKQRSNAVTWWLTIYTDELTKITKISFIDTGIGIFKSSKIKNFTKFAVNFGLKSRSDILLAILNGEIKSSTGLPWRGKGLPKIYTDYKNKNIKKLHIISNDVFANFDESSHMQLKKPLNGTLIYWEIHPN